MADVLHVPIPRRFHGQLPLTDEAVDEDGQLAANLAVRQARYGHYPTAGAVDRVGILCRTCPCKELWFGVGNLKVFSDGGGRACARFRRLHPHIPDEDAFGCDVCNQFW